MPGGAPMRHASLAPWPGPPWPAAAAAAPPYLSIRTRAARRRRASPAPRARPVSRPHLSPASCLLVHVEAPRFEGAPRQRPGQRAPAEAPERKTLRSEGGEARPGPFGEVHGLWSCRQRSQMPWFQTSGQASDVKRELGRALPRRQPQVAPLVPLALGTRPLNKAAATRDCEQADDRVVAV